MTKAPGNPQELQTADLSKGEAGNDASLLGSLRAYHEDRDP